MKGFWRPLSLYDESDTLYALGRGACARIAENLSQIKRFKDVLILSSLTNSLLRTHLRNFKVGMADLQNKMEAHNQDIDRAKEQIQETTQKADSYLTELTKRLEEYESKHSNFEPAGSYLKSALNASRAATQKLKTESQDLSERTVPVAIDGMKQVRSSLDELESLAKTYDQKYVGSRGEQAVDTLHHWVNAGRQSATDALEVSNDQLMKLRDAIGNLAGHATHGAQVAVGEAVRVVEFGDEKLGVSSKASGVVQKVRELDERLGVSATAAKVDSKVTGGLGCKVASTTVEIVSESVNYISETLHNAKITAQQSETVQDIEAKGVAVVEAATEKKNEVKSAFSEGYQKGRGKVGMAAKKTEEKVGQAKDMAQDKAGQAMEKGGQMKDMAQEKAGQAKDTAKDITGQAMEKGGQMKGMVQEKAGQAKGMVQDKAGEAVEKGGEMKDMAQEKAGQAKGMVQDKASEAIEKGGEMKDMAEDKGNQVKDMAQDKADQAKEATKSGVGAVKEKTSETANQVQGKTGEMKESTKDKASHAARQVKENGKESQHDRHAHTHPVNTIK